MGRGIRDALEMVSVVILTRGRPHLVLRAVESALTQTYSPIEVVVVVDGPDEATARALERVDDPRLRVVTLPTNMGEMDARNAGVNEARGTWIAFLDDDDEMLPRRLETQIEAARHSPHPSPIVTSRFIAHTLKGEFVWPRRLMAPSEPLSEYLFRRNSFFAGEREIVPSVYFAKKELFEAVRFRSGVRWHGDWEWLLRASALEGVGIEFVPEPLAVREMREDHASMTNIRDWRYSLSWVRKNRDLVTPRAYAGFVLTKVGAAAAREGNWRVLWPLLREATRVGRPNAVELLLPLGMGLIPQKARSRLRALLMKGDRKEPSRQVSGQSDG